MSAASQGFAESSVGQAAKSVFGKTSGGTGMSAAQAGSAAATSGPLRQANIGQSGTQPQQKVGILDLIKNRAMEGVTSAIAGGLSPQLSSYQGVKGIGLNQLDDVHSGTGFPPQLELLLRQLKTQSGPVL